MKIIITIHGLMHFQVQKFSSNMNNLYLLAINVFFVVSRLPHEYSLLCDTLSNGSEFTSQIKLKAHNIPWNLSS